MVESVLLNKFDLRRLTEKGERSGLLGVGGGLLRSGLEGGVLEGDEHGPGSCCVTYHA